MTGYQLSNIVDCYRWLATSWVTLLLTVTGDWLPVEWHCCWLLQVTGYQLSDIVVDFYRWLATSWVTLLTVTGDWLPVEWHCCWLLQVTGYLLSDTSHQPVGNSYVSGRLQESSWEWEGKDLRTGLVTGGPTGQHSNVSHAQNLPAGDSGGLVLPAVWQWGSQAINRGHVMHMKYLSLWVCMECW